MTTDLVYIFAGTDVVYVCCFSISNAFVSMVIMHFLNNTGEF